MRHTHRCPKCQHPEVLYLPHLADTQRDHLAAHISSTWTSLTHHGRFEAYLCRACGYTELYAQRPDQIPVKDIPGAKLLVSEKGKSYRR